MERIDDPSNLSTVQTPLATVSPGYFRRPSVLAGDQGTILTGDWANDIQENIIDPILSAGITLAKGDETQLTAAINSLAASLISTHNVAASTIVTGHVEFATAVESLALSSTIRGVTPAGLGALVTSESQRGVHEFADATEVAALSDLTRGITPGRLTDAFEYTSNANGDAVKFPGGFIVQWGELTGTGHGWDTQTLPVAYSGTNYRAFVELDSQQDHFTHTETINSTTFQIDAGNVGTRVSWVTVGI